MTDTKSDISAADLRCDYLRNPLGIDDPRPRLTWSVQSRVAGQEQTAYRILVSSSAQPAAGESGLRWDSGKQTASVSRHIPYDGPPLASAQRVYWRVQLWDRDGRPGPVSGAAWWETGLLEPSDWKAGWIAGEAISPLFRGTFTVSRAVAGARLYLCGQGVYEARLNGRPVSDRVLGPQLSVFPARMYYDTFDVTALLQPQQNVVAVQLVPGWFGGDRNAHAVIKRPEGPGHALIAQLDITYGDGSRETTATDGSWKTADSHFEPVRSHWIHCYQGSGERNDAGKVPLGCDRPGFDDTGWAAAQVIKAPTERLNAAMIEPNRIVETVRPVSVSAPREVSDQAGFDTLAESAGARNWSLETMTNPTFARNWKPEFVKSYEGHGNAPTAGMEADFGKHVSGWVRLDATGEPGDTVTLFGLDQHRLRGGAKEDVGLRFVHRAFRYVPIHYSGNRRRPRIENIRALAIQNDVRRTGRFQCSNPVLNRIHDVSARTWAALLLSGMPTDSWREHLGSGLIENCESSFYWCEVGAFYHKWMLDHRDNQRPDGYFSMSGAPIAYDYWSPNSAKNAIVLVPWLMYLYYGDRAAVEANYPAMRRWLRLCAPKSDQGRTWQPPEDHGEAEAGYGDHGRPSARWYDPHTGDLFETLHIIHCFRMAEQMAGLLGEAGDVREYAGIRARLTAKVNRDEFLDRSRGCYGENDQGCQALALHEQTAPPELRGRVAENLIRDVMETRGGHLNTGFLGTWYLLKTLTALRRPEVAVKILTNAEPPSFATLLQHPDSPEELTFLPEFFGKGMIPHPGWCNAGAWFYRALAGIQPDWEEPGFRRVIIRPQITGELAWVKAEYDSIAGTIKAAWTRQDRRIELTVTIPVNSRARVYVPAETPGSARASAAARLVGMDEGCAVFDAAGGVHVFQSELKGAVPGPT